MGARRVAVAVCFAAALLGAPASAERALPPNTPKQDAVYAPGAASAPILEAPGLARVVGRPGDVSGLAVPPGEEPARQILSDLLSPARAAVEFLFYAGENIAGLIDDEQIVPRVSDILSGRRGGMFVFPTAFAETGHKPSVGARMIAASRGFASSWRFGYGGSHELVTEGRLRYVGSRPLPLALSIEGLFDQRSEREFDGVGQTPKTDPRNHFLGEPRTGYYRQYRGRAIMSVGLRPNDSWEIFLSTSLLRTRVYDDPTTGADKLSLVLTPESTPGAYTPRTIGYTELAVRLDTRAHRGLPSPGWLAEAYGGYAYGVAGDDSGFARMGVRAGAYFPIVRQSNIFAAIVRLDGVSVTRFIPFFELPNEREFRGFNSRRDNVSLLTTMDYWWIFSEPFAARLFTDVSIVGPSIGSLPWGRLRWVTGFGAAVASATDEIARLNFAFGPQDVRVSLSIGLQSAHGDRQHRE